MVCVDSPPIIKLDDYQYLKNGCNYMDSHGKAIFVVDKYPSKNFVDPNTIDQYYQYLNNIFKQNNTFKFIKHIDTIEIITNIDNKKYILHFPIECIDAFSIENNVPSYSLRPKIRSVKSKLEYGFLIVRIGLDFTDFINNVDCISNHKKCIQ